MICLNDVFLRKAMTDAALNTFLNVLLIFNICQYLLVEVKVGGWRLKTTDRNNSIHPISRNKGYQKKPTRKIFTT